MFKETLKKIVITIITLEAKIVLRKYKPQIIAITGSVGKTTTKDAITTVLDQKFYARSSEKSFNSELGVPLTILGCGSGWNSAAAWVNIIFEGLALILLKNHYPRWLILEVGTDKPGDIKKIAKWLKPDVVVMTRFGETPVHVEFFPSREALIAEKTHLAKALKKGGLLVLNYDDKDVLELSKTISGVKVLTYGAGDGAMVRGSHKEISYADNGAPNGMMFKVEYKGGSLPLKIMGVLGDGTFYSTLAAFSVGIGLEVNMVSMIEALNTAAQAPGRARVIRGIEKATLIDDTYNSSPTAVSAALAVLGEIKNKGRKIAVLGDMLELGKHSIDEHKKMGAQVKEVADVLVTVGPLSKIAGEEAYKNKMQKGSIFHFNDSFAAGDFLKRFVEKGDVVLLKGSQGIRMERAVEEILLDSANKRNILVRQESEWQ